MVKIYNKRGLKGESKKRKHSSLIGLKTAFVLVIATFIVAAIMFSNTLIRTFDPPDFDPKLAKLKGRLPLRPDSSESIIPPGHETHVILSGSCTDQMDWMTVVAAHTFKKVNHPGTLWRFYSCNRPPNFDKLPKLNEPFFKFYSTPDWTRLKIGPSKWQDFYSPYNKPKSLIKWLDENKHLTEATLHVLDTDMIFMKDHLPEYIPPGHPEGFDRTLIGMDLTGRKKWEDLGICDMLAKSNLSCDGFFGKSRKDCRRWAVGVPYMMHIKDWRRLAPRWLYWTIQLRRIEKVRTHPAIGWLCEMLSYMIAAYELKLVHKAHRELVLLGEGPLKPENKMIHYGHAYPECCRHKEWGFYKHDWPDPELLSCTGRNIQDPDEYLPRMDELIKNRTMDHRAKWMLPSLAPRIFEAIREYRQTNCGPDWKPKRVPPGKPKIKKK